MNKQEYIEHELLDLSKAWSSKILSLGAVFIFILSALDYVVTPENFHQFLIYRVICSSILLVLYVVNKQDISDTLHFITILLGTIIASTTIEMMILDFGGHQSTYYAGMIIVLLFILGFLPSSMKATFILVLSIYAIYLFPILIFDDLTNMRIFYNNNMFLVAAICGGLIWRYVNQLLLVKKLSLEYELSQEKSKLENYSSHLETVVEARTKELRKSEAMLQTLHENANDGIIITDQNGIILKVNQRASEIHGFKDEQMIGMSAGLLEIEKNKTVWSERLSRLLNGESLIYETEHYKKDGTTINLEISSKAITIGEEVYIQSIHRDISEKKRLQSQLLHSQKMESIGTLAGGIAHDFNNILTSILGFTDLILDDGGTPNNISKQVRVIESSARKGSSLVSKLLSFARRGSIEAVPFEVNTIIEDTITMLSRIVSKNIAIETNLNHMIPPIIGDANQIEQILMNLIINARDAMPQGGEIIISTDAVELSPDDVNFTADIRKGMFIKLSVRDSGTGIDQKHLDRIFEPFYSTKEVGKGTGLGLAMVYGIVKEHGGYINVESEIGVGTDFSIYIPASPAHVATKQGIAHEEQLTMQQEILVIDDEIPVLEFVRQSLLKEGYKVRVFDSPLDGLGYYKENKDRVGLVITDIVMPSMDGNELITRIREIKPDESIIATTGFGKVLGDVKIDGILKKPFQSSKLAGMVQKVVSSKKSTS
jgi:two-component system cell cycle sensor histidine kinase/response regulator CckA